MLVDIASQKPLNDVFTTNRNHRLIHSTTSNGTELKTNQISMVKDLGRRAEHVLGRPSEQIDYDRQTSLDLNIPQMNKSSNVLAKSNIFDSTVIKKERNQLIDEQLVQLIMKLVTLPPMTKFPTVIRRSLINTKETTESDENSVKSNDNENDSNDDDENDKNNENENDVIDDDDFYDESFPRKCSNDNFNHDSNQTEAIQTTTNDEMLTESEPENNEDENSSDPTKFSLSDFVQKSTNSIEKPIENETNLKPTENETLVDSSNNSTISRKEELIRSFSSLINMTIDLKQPSLPITIPKHLFFDQWIPNDNKQIRSKRSVEEQEQILATKKSKTKHFQENANTFSIQTERNLPLKIESNSNGIYSTTNVVLQQQTLGKPMASVKPLLQSTSSENLTSNNNNVHSESNVDRLTTNNAVSINPNRKNYVEILNKSTKQLNSIAKQKKREADVIRRQTYDEIRQSMSLYLESVCYFIQCAHFEPAVEQRVILLSATITMLDHLAQNHLKMFHLSNMQSLSNLRQKFLLINYWLQSLLFKLRYQTDWTSIERCASQINDHLINQRKSPTSNNSSDKNNQIFSEFSKYMINSFQSDSFWSKADRLSKESSLKDFLEQLTKLNQNRRLSRDDQISDFILYIFDAIDLLRSTVA